jgi:hypothetical protein
MAKGPFRTEQAPDTLSKKIPQPLCNKNGGYHDDSCHRQVRSRDITEKTHRKHGPVRCRRSPCNAKSRPPRRPPIKSDHPWPSPAGWCGAAVCLGHPPRFPWPIKTGHLIASCSKTTQTRVTLSSPYLSKVVTNVLTDSSSFESTKCGTLAARSSCKLSGKFTQHDMHMRAAGIK